MLVRVGQSSMCVVSSTCFKCCRGMCKKTVVKGLVETLDNHHSITYCLLNSSHISGTALAVVVGLLVVLYLCRIRCGRGWRALQGKRPSPVLLPTAPLPLPPPSSAIASQSNIIPYSTQVQDPSTSREIQLWRQMNTASGVQPSMGTSASAPMLIPRPPFPVEATVQGAL